MIKNLTQVLFVTILFFVIAFPAQAGAGSWTTGWNLDDVPSNNVISQILISPSDKNVLYAGGYSGIRKSINGGASWTKLENFGTHDVRTIAIDPKNTNIVYAGAASEGMYKSVDAGQTWTQTSLVDQTGSMTYIFSAVISTHPKNRIFAASHAGSAPLESTGVFVSSDNGTSWIKSGLEGHEIRSLYADPNSKAVYAVDLHEGVYKLHNNGNSWELIFNHPSGNTPNFTFTVAVDPKNSKKIYVGAWDGLYISIDSGKTWKKDPTPWMGKVRDITVSPFDSKIIYIRLHGGVVKSIDGGVNWDGAAYSHSNLLVWNGFAVAWNSLTENILYAGMIDNPTQAPQGVWQFTDINN
ncbi:MAG TPA: hypothetical protein VNA13_02000 [Xanthomonadales bacterium]|nr:hypothetical protein [Xanthomonadales bacterium]